MNIMYSEPKPKAVTKPLFGTVEPSNNAFHENNRLPESDYEIYEKGGT